MVGSKKLELSDFLARKSSLVLIFFEEIPLFLNSKNSGYFFLRFLTAFIEAKGCGSNAITGIFGQNSSARELNWPLLKPISIIRFGFLTWKISLKKNYNMM